MAVMRCAEYQENVYSRKLASLKTKKVNKLSHKLNNSFPNDVMKEIYFFLTYEYINTRYIRCVSLWILITILMYI